MNIEVKFLNKILAKNFMPQSGKAYHGNIKVIQHKKINQCNISY